MNAVADYFITGVQYDTDSKGHKCLTSVLVHSVSTTNQIGVGVRMDTDAVITLLKQGYKIMTAKWSYSSRMWVHGGYVIVAVRQSSLKETLSMRPDSRPTAGLDHLIPLPDYAIV